MRITHPNQLSKGMTIYLAQAFTDGRMHNTGIYKYVILEVPVTSTNTKDPNFITVDCCAQTFKVDNNKDELVEFQSSYTGSNTRSMKDMGIIPNKYNDHQTFDELEDAKDYVNNLLNFAKTKTAICDYDRAMKGFDFLGA